jgi:hypothetical protein
MKKQSKPKKGQFNLRIEEEFQTRLAELGEKCGFPSGNQFVIEAMRRYGDILADAIVAEDKEAEETRERSRERLRGKIQSPRR